MTVLIGDISKAERRGYERGLHFALQALEAADQTSPGNPDAMKRNGSRLPPEAAGIRYLLIHALRMRLQEELDSVGEPAT